jgi:hypothetical protein
VNAEQELDLLMAEPTEDKDVVLFVIGYPDTPKTYTYAAVRTKDGQWFVTGADSPQAYRWRQLVGWFKSKNMTVHSMHLATGWEAML